MFVCVAVGEVVLHSPFKWQILKCSPICPSFPPIIPLTKCKRVQNGGVRDAKAMKCSESTLCKVSVLCTSRLSSTTPIYLLLSQIGSTVYSIEVKMVTRAEGHGGTPDPIELTSPGWLSFQLSSAQTGVSSRWTKCKLISTQHTVRGRAGMTAIYN